MFTLPQFHIVSLLLCVPSQRQSSEHSLGNIGTIQPLKSADKIHISTSLRSLQLLLDKVREKKLMVQKTRLVFKQP